MALPAHARSACEAHREWIEAQIRLGRNATAIYQDLVDHHGFQSRYNSVKRFCRGLRKPSRPNSTVWSSCPARKPKSITAKEP